MNAPDPDLTRQSLKLIFEYQQDLIEKLGPGPYYTHLAEQLSKIAGRPPASYWTGRYIQSVASGTLSPSAAFSLAIDAYGASMDDVPTLVSYTVTVQILARPGAVIPGSIVLSESRPCKWPGCHTVFVPRVPWQEICNREMHLLADRAMRQAQREKKKAEHP